MKKMSGAGREYPLENTPSAPAVRGGAGQAELGRQEPPPNRSIEFYGFYYYIYISRNISKYI